MCSSSPSSSSFSSALARPRFAAQFSSIAETADAPDVVQETPMELIAKQPVILVDGNTAVCTGGTNEETGVYGHPAMFIQLHKTDNTPTTCIYCGLRYMRSGRH
jgi:uncharacterized Zn-finger protein